jgi:HD superfamily phosphohydrolase
VGNFFDVNQTNKLKIFNDPIYGFISVPNDLVYDLIQHSYFQRLRRITQMGLSYLVYPGAHHTRFHHALGCLHNMQKAVSTLKMKGVEISQEEENALYIAILLHDIGHGPFSHAMEHSIVEGVGHESISLKLMEVLNHEFNGKLSLAIQVFKGEYHRKFMYQLISSQLDMDRMDYLKRDSFYSGVAEGNINSDRLIQMLHVVDDTLVLEEKAIYSVEKFLMARRLMYWQVYLHKTSLAAELILTKTLKRAKELSLLGQTLPASQSLNFFLQNIVTENTFDSNTLNLFANLDDIDILGALKEWIHHDDFVLSSLSKMIIHRDLPKIVISDQKLDANHINDIKEKVAKAYKITILEAEFFVMNGKIKNQAYKKKDFPIMIVLKNKTVIPIEKLSDQLNSVAFSKSITKFYLCFPKMLT